MSTPSPAPHDPDLQKPWLGFGLGLRPEHYQDVLEAKPAVDWFEVISENYLVDGGKPLYFLDRIRAHHPMVMHGVSLSIGGSDPLDFEYLAALKQLAARIEPEWISDHLCWTGIDGRNLHDLLPLPYTEEAIAQVVERVARVPDDANAHNSLGHVQLMTGRVEAAVRRIRGHTDLPIAVGFGIRTPEQAGAIAQVADAAVVGSALVDQIARALNDQGRAGPDLARSLHDQVKALAEGVRNARR